MPVARIVVAGALAVALLAPATAAAALTAARFGRASPRPGRAGPGVGRRRRRRARAGPRLELLDVAGRARVAVITEGALELYATTGGPALWRAQDLACGPIEWAPDASKLACVTAGESLVLLNAATVRSTRSPTGRSSGCRSRRTRPARYADLLIRAGAARERVDLATRRSRCTVGDRAVWGPRRSRSASLGGRTALESPSSARRDGFRASRVQGRPRAPWLRARRGRATASAARGHARRRFTSFEATPSTRRGGARLIAGVTPATSPATAAT